MGKLTIVHCSVAVLRDKDVLFHCLDNELRDSVIPLPDLKPLVVISASYMWKVTFKQDCKSIVIDRIHKVL